MSPNQGMIAAAASLDWHYAKRSLSCVPTKLVWVKPALLNRTLAGVASPSKLMLVEDL